MNNLVSKQEIEEVTLNSREVAEMLNKEHKALLREIEGSSDRKTVGIIPTLESANFALSKYFIPSTYKSGTREYKCYEITKMGCHMLGNKLQGEKGILFTAKYVERFNEMEKQLSSGQTTNQLSAIDLFESQVKALREVENKVEKVDKKFDELPLFPADVKNLKKIVNKVVVPLLGGKKSNAYKPLSKKVFSDLYGQVFREFGVDASSEIKRKDFEVAKEFVRNYTLPTALKNEIEMLNNQRQLNI